MLIFTHMTVLQSGALTADPDLHNPGKDSCTSLSTCLTNSYLLLLRVKIQILSFQKLPSKQFKKKSATKKVYGTELHLKEITLLVW